jgi:hypothetical protein
MQIRPTKLPSPELYSLDAAALLVTNAIHYEPLENELHMPEHLLSPVATLSFQVGDAFDMSVLLVSILIGTGFDAYVIVGYAPPAVVRNDQTKTICPLLEEEAAAEAAAALSAARDDKSPPKGKYSCVSLSLASLGFSRVSTAGLVALEWPRRPIHLHALRGRLHLAVWIILAATNMN